MALAIEAKLMDVYYLSNSNRVKEHGSTAFSFDMHTEMLVIPYNW